MTSDSIQKDVKIPVIIFDDKKSVYDVLRENISKKLGDAGKDKVEFKYKDGAFGLEEVKEVIPPQSVSIVDINFGQFRESEGLHIIHTIKSQQPNCKVLAHTAYPEEEERAIEAKADKFLVKGVKTFNQNINVIVKEIESFYKSKSESYTGSNQNEDALDEEEGLGNLGKKSSNVLPNTYYVRTLVLRSSKPFSFIPESIQIYLAKKLLYKDPLADEEQENIELYGYLWEATYRNTFDEFNRGRGTSQTIFISIKYFLFNSWKVVTAVEVRSKEYGRTGFNFPREYAAHKFLSKEDPYSLNPSSSLNGFFHFFIGNRLTYAFLNDEKIESRPEFWDFCRKLGMGQIQIQKSLAQYYLDRENRSGDWIKQKLALWKQPGFHSIIEMFDGKIDEIEAESDLVHVELISKFDSNLTPTQSFSLKQFEKNGLAFEDNTFIYTAISLKNGENYTAEIEPT